jgi:hypothetical protein
MKGTTSLRSAHRVPNDQAFSQISNDKEVKSADDSFSHHGVQLMRRYVTARRVAVVAANLTDRDRQIMTTVGTVRVATARQLLSLHGADITTRRGQAVLAALSNRQVLTRLGRVVGGVRAGSAGYVYTLGPVGARLLAPARRRPGRPFELSTLFLDHSLAVSQLYTDLALAARAGALDLADFQGEPRCWRGFYGSGGERLTLKPDAYAKLRLGRYEDHWFLEVDRGTESRSTLARKAEAYRRYWQSGTEQDRTGVMPRVLFVVPDERRREVLVDVLGRQPAESWDLFGVTTMSEAVNRLAQGAAV